MKIVKTKNGIKLRVKYNGRFRYYSYYQEDSSITRGLKCVLTRIENSINSVDDVFTFIEIQKQRLKQCFAVQRLNKIVDTYFEKETKNQRIERLCYEFNKTQKNSVFEDIVKEYGGHIVNSVKKYTHLEHEEIKQAVMVGIYEGIRNVDLDKGKYSQSVFYRIRNQIWRLNEHYNKHKVCSPVDNGFLDINISKQNVLQETIKKELNSELNKMIEKQPKFLQSALRKYIIGDKTGGRNKYYRVVDILKEEILKQKEMFYSYIGG